MGVVAQVVQLLDDLEEEVATGHYINSAGQQEVRLAEPRGATMWAPCFLYTLSSTVVTTGQPHEQSRHFLHWSRGPVTLFVGQQGHHLRTAIGLQL